MFGFVDSDFLAATRFATTMMLNLSATCYLIWFFIRWFNEHRLTIGTVLAAGLCLKQLGSAGHQFYWALRQFAESWGSCYLRDSNPSLMDEAICAWEQQLNLEYAYLIQYFYWLGWIPGSCIVLAVLLFMLIAKRDEHGHISIIQIWKPLALTFILAIAFFALGLYIATLGPGGRA